MTTEVLNRAAPPARGQPIGAIVFRECSTGELRVQLLRVSATDTLVRAGVLQTEVDGCGSATPSTPPLTTPSPAALAISSEPVAVETKERTDTAGALVLVAAAAAAGLAALVLGVLLSRRGTR